MYFWFILAGLAIFFFLLFRFAFPAFMGLKDTEASRRRIEDVQATGVEIFSARLASSIGGVSLGGFMRLEVYPGGVVLLPTLMPGAAIPLAEIRSVRVVKELVRRGWIEIDHASPDIVSPVYLHIALWGRAGLLQALERMTGQGISSI